jgi:hypothetical protein
MKAYTTLFWIVALQSAMFVASIAIPVGIVWAVVHFALKYW